MTPEQEARAEIDRLLIAAGWHVCDYRAANLHAARGVAIREFELLPGHGTADYLLYLDGKAGRIIGPIRRPTPTPAAASERQRTPRSTPYRPTCRGPRKPHASGANMHHVFR